MKRTFTTKILSLVVCIAVLFANLVSVVPAFATETDPVVLISGSDFQGEDNESKYVENIVAKLGADYGSIDGLLFAGDFTRLSNLTEADSRAGIDVFTTAIWDVFPDLQAEDMVLIQGNHDPYSLVKDGTLAPDGYNDTQDYGVFVINEDYYSYKGTDPEPVEEISALLKDYLNAKIKDSYTKPIFIVSHLPLHYSVRTYKNGDGMYGSYLFDIINEAGAAGLNIIFMFGHDHANGYDDYLGGDAVYLTKGDTMPVAQASQTIYVEETLNFTYLNAGYTAYYLYGESTTGYGAQTMVAYEITDDDVTMYRYYYNAYGDATIGDLKKSGTDAYTDSSAYNDANPEINTKVYASGQKVVLNKDIDTSVTVGEDEEQLLFASYEDLSASVLHEVTTVESGNKYIIVNAAENIGVLTNDTGTADHMWVGEKQHLLLSDEVPKLESDAWLVEANPDAENGFYMQFTTGEHSGEYLASYQFEVAVKSKEYATTFNFVYDEEKAAFRIENENSIMLVAADSARAIPCNNESYYDDYSYWKIYEVATYEGTTSDLNVNAGFLANEKLGFRFTASGDNAATAFDSYVLAFNRLAYTHLIEEITVEGEYVLSPVTEIVAGTNYVIVNKTTGTVLTNTIENGNHWYEGLGDQNHVLLGGEATVGSDTWSFVTYDDGYAIAHPDGGYLSPNTVNVHITGEYSWITPVYVVYNKTEAAFEIYRNTDTDKCNLVACNDLYSNYVYAIGCNSTETTGDFANYKYWEIYEVVEKTETKTTLYQSYNEWELFELTAGESVDWTGIAAYEMTSALKFAFFGVDSEGNTEYIATAETTFADMVANTAATAEDKTVYADLLNYGIATQAYFASKYPDSDLAAYASVFENAYSDYATNAEDATIDLGDTDYTRYVDAETGATIYASLQIQSSNRIVFAVDSGTADVDTLTLEVYDGETLIASKAFSELELAGGKYHYFPSEDEAIALYDTNKVLTAKVTDGTNVIVTRNYSVAAFVKNVMLADESLAALGTAVAQITCSLNSDEGAGDTDQPYLQKVTPDNIITDGSGSAEYIFVNNKTGWVLGTTATTNSLNGVAISVDTTGVTVNSPAWTVTYNAENKYFLSTDTITSMAPNNTNVSLTATDAPRMYYIAEKDGWVITRSDSYIKYTLQTGSYFGSSEYAYGYRANGSSDDSSITVSNYASINDASYWTIYQVVEVAVDGGEDPVEPETPVEPTTTLQAVTVLEDGKSYVIVNNATQTAITTTTATSSQIGENQTVLTMAEATVESSTWLFNGSDTSFKIQNEEGKCLKPNNPNVTLEGSFKCIVEYDSEAGGWNIYRVGSKTYYLQTYYDETAQVYYACGMTGTATDAACLWTIYEVVEA